MSDTQAQAAPNRPDALFDRYTLPKVALAVILVASLVGSWVTTALSGSPYAALAVAKWAYFVAMGVLAGGLVWKHFFVRPADLGKGAGAYCEDMYARFDTIATGALVVVAGGGVVTLWAYGTSLGWSPPLVGYAALVGVFLAVAGRTTYRNLGTEAQFRSPMGLAALTLGLAVVVTSGIAEAAIGGHDLLAAGVRVLHLLTFALWIGGAVWNIFVAVPTGQNRPTVPVVRAAGQQLERFRWAVRFIIPTLFLTGVYQAIDGLGTEFSWYLGNLVGIAVLVKVGFIALLVVIFKLCPMWRACSPIEGVCELEELGGDSTNQDTAPGSDPVGRGSEVAGND